MTEVADVVIDKSTRTLLELAACQPGVLVIESARGLVEVEGIRVTTGFVSGPDGMIITHGEQGLYTEGDIRTGQVDRDTPVEANSYILRPDWRMVVQTDEKRYSVQFSTLNSPLVKEHLATHVRRADSIV